ncbi:hypothetical protein FBZ87_10323 [Nitrospirillum amazonense]|uniref:DUF2274 domain-containing protein n=1 Tax=Nitrospirillum amazonense TaxID=28077 RepID=A0A560K1N0_9PROT|nr:DUF2274 domain-containing protein [Nitrospirillum amazonense]TWB77211.1 hypothetical protein FBZ87_10323 [Nitrospirillum amazonense]
MLKLAKLPDRTPVRLTVTLSPELHQRLQGYAALYRATYGETEAVAELVPFMLDAFLDSDRAYAKAQREELPMAEVAGPRRGRGKASASETIVPSNPED